MGILSPEWDGRIGHWLRTLEADFYEPWGTIDFKAFRTEKHLAYNELRWEEFVHAPPGFTWGNTYEYCWFLGDVHLTERAGKPWFARFSTGSAILRKCLALTAACSGFRIPSGTPPHCRRYLWAVMCLIWVRSLLGGDGWHEGNFLFADQLHLPD